jgi:hypothetical protein
MRRRLGLSGLVDLLVVGGILIFLFWQFHAPSLIFLNTTTAGGDTGSHVALPLYMKQHLLTHGRVTGWDPQWYDGFPAFTFYFPLPSLLVVLVNVFITYNVAFKLVTVLGSFLLPLAAWAFGRLWGMRSPAPAVLAVATLPYLFDRTFTIYGGNIASTLAGEYAFSIGLSLGILFLGLLARALRTGRNAGLTAFVLGLTVISHLLPTLFVLVGALVILAMHLRWRSFRLFLATLAVAGLLSGFWWVPFLLREAYTTDMGWQKITTYLHILFPSADDWVAVLAAVGALATVVGWAVERRQRSGPRHQVGIFLVLMAAISAAAVRWAPQGKIWNARFLPFWVFCLYLLAGIGVVEGARLSGAAYRLLRRGSDGPWLRVGTEVVVPVLTLAVAVVFVGGPLGSFTRLGRDVGLPQLGNELGDSPADASFVPDWIRWNYSGYQQKASYPEYQALIQTMANVGRRYGCGRAMWEYESQENRFGTPEALMLLPYWTNDCIDSMEGLLFESSATTPYHFINQSELSVAPSDAMLGLPYAGLNVSEGIAHLQMLGVKYYMTLSPQIQAQASADPALKLVASTGPWPVQYTVGSQTQTQDRTWDIYEVKGSAQVAALTDQPVVVTGPVSSAKAWLNLSVAWYDRPSEWPVLLAASGPSDWARRPAGSEDLPHRPLPKVRVSHIQEGDDSLSFDVSRIGVPVEVKTSYFPNWKATGASGPYRVTPDLMVVVPTSKHVRMAYGWTPVDDLGWFFTAVGVAGLFLLGRTRPWASSSGPEPEPAGAPDEAADRVEDATAR